MNESADDETHYEFQDDRIDALKSLKPRAARLDWDAIQSALDREESAIPAQPTPRIGITDRIPKTVAWWSGMVAGAALMFFAMQWFVLRDLAAKIERLEQSARQAQPSSPKTSFAKASVNDPAIQDAEPLIDVNALLETPNLTVGSFRRGRDRLVVARSMLPGSEASSSVNLDEASPTQTESAPATGHREADPPEPAMNRLRLQKELQRDIY